MATPAQPTSQAETEGTGRRQLRAVSLIAVALIVVVAAGFAYLRPPPTHKQATPPASIDPLLYSSNSVNFAFITPSIGWASLAVAGSSLDAAQFRIFRTVDGAKHWQLQFEGQTAVSRRSNGFSPITVQFFDKTYGFMAVGGPIGQLYRTIDGGAHWDSVGLPPSPQIEFVTFSDPSYGWLLATSASTGSQALNLYATGDAGTSWQRLPDPPADASGLSFRRPSDAWMGGFGPGPPHVYSSSDAGQSWQRHDVPGFWDPALGYDAFPDLVPVAGVVVTAFCECANSPGPGPSYYTSFDGDTTWRVVPSPGFLAYQDSTHWWATTSDALFKSSDAGRSWKQVATMPTSWQVFGPVILDPMHAWASINVMGGFGLALTSDGGLHWTLAKVPKAT